MTEQDKRNVLVMDWLANLAEGVGLLGVLFVLDPARIRVHPATLLGIQKMKELVALLEAELCQPVEKTAEALRAELNGGGTKC